MKTGMRLVHPKGAKAMIILLVVLASLLAVVWVMLDKFWLDDEEEARLSHYLPDKDHV